MKETNISQLCRMRASDLGAIVWRNNVGSLPDSNGRWVQYGLCKGSSDLIGMYKGRFLAIEVKVPGAKPKPDQVRFLQAVHRDGGIAGVARCADDVNKILTSGSLLL